MTATTADRTTGAAAARERVDTPRNSGRSGGRPWYIAAGTVLALLFISPLLWAVLRSMQPDAAITAPLTGSSFDALGLGNYRALLGGSVDLWPYIANSFMVCIGTALATAVISTLAGYGLGRFRFRLSGLSFGLILLTLMIPFQAILTPLFLEFHALGLSDSRLGLVVFYTTFNLPFGVFVMRNTFASMPKELEDSAYVDGCGIMTTLFRVLRPLALPGIATTILYTFLSSWTEFLGALTLLTSTSKLTLPVALLNVQNGTFGAVNFGFLVAGAVLSMIPTVVLYVALQRYYVGGLTAGAVKG